jgi:hypothetical protein
MCMGIWWLSMGVGLGDNFNDLSFNTLKNIL